MHMVLWLRTHADDLQIAKIALEAGVSVKAVSPTFSQAGNRSGLILGLGDFDLDQLEQAIRILSEVIQTY
ncbi:hypothetical protein [Acinetobacter sp. ANC 5502]